MMLRTFAALAAVLSTALSLGCGDDKPAATSASAAPTSAPTAAKSAKPKADGPPVVTVDDQGPYINGERMKLKENGGPEKLKRVIGDLKDKTKQIDLVVLKKAMVPDVIAVVHELGAVGVPSIKIKADGRDDLPKELIVIPQSKLTDKVAPCSVVAMVDKDLSTDVWAVQGGAGRKHSKGFAGPDLTLTGDTLKKAFEKCESPVAFFSADESLEWELAHNIGGTMVKADATQKVKTLVLLDEIPVPGRAVKVGP